MTHPIRLRAALLASLLAFGALPAQAQSADAAEVGWGVGSVLSSVLYAPAKLVYAGSGLLFGGLGYALSGGDGAIAAAVIAPAVRGDYVVTPAHLRGERRLVFVGGSEPALPEDPYADEYGDFSYDYEVRPPPRSASQR